MTTYSSPNVVFRDGLPVALIDFDIAHPTTRRYDVVNALWYWADRAIHETERPLSRTPTSRTGSRYSRTPMA